MAGHVGGQGQGAVVRQALRNPELRRVLVAYLLFNVAEWATWIGLIVWAYGVGGVRGASAIALVDGRVRVLGGGQRMSPWVATESPHLAYVVSAGSSGPER